ncbi:MAG TPA: glycosyltransferase, partial [Azospirillaceae bacterium]|nr:glycosyltransferase [Azospirillaceae bacterium]
MPVVPWTSFRLRLPTTRLLPSRRKEPALFPHPRQYRTRRVLMMGTSTEALGGVAAVQRVILDHWRPKSYRLTHLATHVDGDRWRKLATAGRALALLVRAAVTERPDLVHVHFSARGSFWRKAVFITAASLCGLPVIGHAHAGGFPAFYAACPPWRQRTIRWVLNRLDRLVVLTDDWRDFYAPLYRRGAPVVLPNPVPFPIRPPQGAKGPPVMLALGRLGPNKGTYDVLRAIPAVLEHYPDAEFWFGGDGDVEKVSRLVAAESWGRQVRLLGWVSGAEKEAALTRAHVFLLPSYFEGLPMAVLEAMAFGLPVITTPVGGIPEAVTHAETGLLVEPGNVADLVKAILSLLDDPARAAALGVAAQRLVRQRYD